MRKVLLFSFALSLTALWLIGCGGDSTKVAVLPQTTSVAFMQQAPSAGTWMFSPVLGTFSTTAGNTTFSTKTYVDTGTNQPIALNMFSITLSADGKKAAFELYGGLEGTSGQADIFIANADGTGTPLQITNDVYEDILPQFSPDGTKVVYTSYRPLPGQAGTDCNVVECQDQIVIANSNGTGTAQVLPIPTGIIWQVHPTYSPDGNKLAMHAGGYVDEVPFDGILLTNADGSNAQILSNPLYSEACYWCVDELPAFTSDGSKIVFSRDNWNGVTEFEDIFVMNAADGTNQTKLTDSVGINNDPLPVNIKGMGQRILFSSNRDNRTSGDGGFDLYRINTDGTGITRLTSNTLYDSFSQWWYEGITSVAAARHSNLLTRRHRLSLGHATPHRVQW